MIHYNNLSIVTPDFPLPRGTSGFTMRSYKEKAQPHLTLFHFLGNHTIAQDFPHGNAKDKGKSTTGTIGLFQINIELLILYKIFAIRLYFFKSSTIFTFLFPNSGAQLRQNSAISTERGGSSK